jgi:hypothetical protein
VEAVRAKEQLDGLTAKGNVILDLTLGNRMDSSLPVWRSEDNLTDALYLFAFSSGEQMKITFDNRPPPGGRKSGKLIDRIGEDFE